MKLAVPSRRRSALLAVAAACIIAAVVAIALVVIPRGPGGPRELAEERVRATRVTEYNPAVDTEGGAEYVAWSQNSRLQPQRYNAYLQRANNPRIKLNTVGEGLTGGIDYPHVVYQQVYEGQSDLKLYDLETGLRSNPPRGVNTKAWEWHPTISGNWLLFTRDERLRGRLRRQSVVLFHMPTEVRVKVATVSRASHSAWSGQVNGGYAVWTRCVPVCNVFKFDLETGKARRLAKPASNPPKHQYAPSVTPDGTVYLARSRKTCDSAIDIVRYGRDDPATGTVVATVPRGRDLTSSFARRTRDGSVDVFYDRTVCGTRESDIYKFTDPA